MPRSIEELEALVREVLEPKYRAQLVARGLARNLVWTEGVVPPGSADFGEFLTGDLLGYGLGLLRAALELRTRDHGNEVARRAFERAAEAIEAVVKDGDPISPERGFYTVIAAAAYHLGHFSARAYSLIPSSTEALNLSDCERALIFLIRRDFDALRQGITWFATGAGLDENLASRLQQISEPETSESDDENLHGEDSDEEPGLPPDKFEVAFSYFQDCLFHKALAFFDHSIETGDAGSLNTAVALLGEGAEAATEVNSIPYWWIFTITRHIVDDLGESSFYARLPQPTGDDSESAWTALRRLYIAELYARKRSEVELWPSQFEAAERAIDVTDDLVAALPTSAGKTRIAELCILRILSLGKRVAFVTPLRALSAQTERSLKETFVPLGFSISSLYGSSGTTGDDADSLKNRNVVVSTPEKLDFALRNDPSLFDDVGLVVFDEAHTIGAGEREVRYEVLVQRLLRREDAGDRRIVCLSAILPHGQQLDDFLAWIRQDEPGRPISCEWRPTRQQFGEVRWNENNNVRLTFRVEDETPWVDPFFTFKPAPEKTKATFLRQFALQSVWRLVEDKQTVLLYCPQRNDVIPLAKAVIELNTAGVLNSLLTVDYSEIADAVNIGREWLGEFHPAVCCLRLGIAIHHGQLPRPFLRAIEHLLRANKIKVTIASPTLAQGLNLSATTVLFYSLMKFGQRMKGEEFANVAGRAGRAFVDVEGRVLGLVANGKHLWHWEQLIKEVRTRDIRSGLFQLIYHFCERIAIGKQCSLDEVAEYVMGHAASWAAPKLLNFKTKNPVAEQAKFDMRWQVDLACIDSAILSLIQQDIPEDKIAEEIDNALTGSLWQRTLSHESDVAKKVTRSLLVGRAGVIWRSSTPLQRKGYFYAGVSFATGQFLDQNAATLTDHLNAADTAFAEERIADAITSVTNFAELIFQIEPFKPEKDRDDWKDLLASWVRGESLSDLAGGADEEVIEFVEGALVYRLVWALEAVRVRNSAHLEEEVPNFGRAALAVETGTASVSAALLIQSGVPSRVAAMKAVADCPASFFEIRGMRRWLLSEPVKTRQRDKDWPTAATHQPWVDFVSGLHVTSLQRWNVYPIRLKVHWADKTPEPGTPVRIVVSQSETLVLSVEFEALGEITPSFAKSPKGIFDVKVDGDFRFIVGEYLGPNDVLAPPKRA